MNTGLSIASLLIVPYENRRCLVENESVQTFATRRPDARLSRQDSILSFIMKTDGIKMTIFSRLKSFMFHEEGLGRKL